jgi:aryl-alcohol dehydrogenase-like predicted oxidoreductase
MQPLYNLYDRAGFERDHDALCVEGQIGVIPFYAPARVFLSGKYRSNEDFSKSAARGEGMANYLNRRGLRI